MKHLVGFEAHGDDLVVDGGYVKGRSRSNDSDKIYNYCKMKGHIKNDCNKLHNKNKNKNRNQLLQF